MRGSGRVKHSAKRMLCGKSECNVLRQIRNPNVTAAGGKQKAFVRVCGGEHNTEWWMSTARRLTIRAFTDDLAKAFHDINAEWISDMFHLEPLDREVLEHPREKIIDMGGVILFVEAEGLGTVGACALKPSGGGGYELTKMGVTSSARGLGAGAFLLEAVIARAVEMGAAPLYLLTNKKCAAAIYLYEKLGFKHDAGIMAEYGARYARCDVAMRYVAARA